MASNNSVSASSNSRFELLRTNFYVIVYSVAFIVLILLFYYNSISYRTKKALGNMSDYKKYVVTGSNLNMENYREKKLCDFYVSSAYKPYLVSNQYLGYSSLKVLEAILLAGVRCVYIDIFNSSMTKSAYPVVNRLKNGEWKFAFNNLNFSDVCDLISKIVFSSGYLNNSNDPFILCLNLKTNGNLSTLNKMKKILYKKFGNHLLDNTFTYSSKNVMRTKIKDLMGKLIVFSSDGYQNSDLEELVNYSWDKQGLKKLSYESLDYENEGANMSVVKMDPNELKNYNMNGITLVTPNENTIFNYNYNPNNSWDSGCQFVFLNFQKIDENMKTYIEKFQTQSFILKPDNMISGQSDMSGETLSLKINEVKEDDTFKSDEVLNCPEKPSEIPNRSEIMADIDNFGQTYRDMVENIINSNDEVSASDFFSDKKTGVCFEINEKHTCPPDLFSKKQEINGKHYCCKK